MGTYLNPGNEGFKKIRRSNYIDKSGMIDLINQRIGTNDDLICVSRPRRFGKSYAVQMLCAYYGKKCDSHGLFHDLEIARTAEYERHLNGYDVIYLDMSELKLYTNGYTDIVPFIIKMITEEIRNQYPEVPVSEILSSTLVNAAEKTGNQFIVIIDEWDAPIRENPAVEQEYLGLLRSLFKSSVTPRAFAAVYMTGILPIKKDGSQSAISDFKEYSMLHPGPFARYTGFTEEEVQNLCKEHNVSFESAKRWYDGYTVGKEHSVYNPFSVMNAVINRRFASYWKKTSAAEALMTYIDMNINGLQEDIVKLTAGEALEVNTDFFSNDFEHFSTKDDVLTLLIHLGYLAYEEKEEWYSGDERYYGYVRIPNEEVRLEFKTILRRTRHSRLIRLIDRSDKLLQDTLEGNEKAVAETIAMVRESEYAPTFYNNEQALRSVIRFAYISCVDQYAKVEELPSGRGIADVVFIPRSTSTLPAMVVELKWNKTAEGALTQIKEKHYPTLLSEYGGEMILVGINYDEKTKAHSCKIEKVQVAD